MRTKVTLAILIFLGGTLGCGRATAPSPAPPLSKLQVMALVAGVTLPENVIYDLHSRGIDFVPDQNYIGLLKAAGAEDRILQALKTAKVNSSNPDEDSSDSPLLEHLSHAGSLIRSHKLDEASKELTASFSGGRGKSAFGFVMGEVLMGQERYPEAVQVYSEILESDPSYPELHVRLSAVYIGSQNWEDSLREARAALVQNPENPPAHMNAGVALAKLQHYDAAKQEYLKAIAAKPDYAPVYYNFADIYFVARDFDKSIEYDKKALALDPNFYLSHYGLGLAYQEMGDHQSAIREYREVKRLAPSMLDARQNLGAELLRTDPAAAIAEFKELAAIAPDWPFCHSCMGGAYLRLGRLDDAEKEFTIAIQQDPASTAPLKGLGALFETEKKYDQALVAYRRAERLDSSDAGAFIGAGRALYLNKDYPSAISELREAVELAPADWRPYDLMGEALEQSGDRKTAIQEYQQAVSLSPKQLQARLDLALALEKSGDWLGALENYRQAAIDEPPIIPNGVPTILYDAQNKYKSAQQRFQQHLSDLRSAGKASEAASVEASLKQHQAAPNFDEQFHLALASSKQSAQQRRFDDAEASAKEAVSIAEKIQPQDARLAEAVGQLGNVYTFRRDFGDASTQYKRQLAVAQQLYGPNSPMLVDALQNLGMVTMEQNDLASSEKDFNQALALVQKTYGENSTQATTSLLGLSHLYFLKKDYSKAESYVLHNVKDYELQMGDTDYRLIIPLNTLCGFYDQTGNSENSVPCHARIVALGEKQFGPDSPYLLRDLTAEAKALRKLGRNDEAAKIEKRTQSLQSAQTNPN